MKAYINLAAFLLTLAANGYANYAKLGGNSTGGVSAQYPNIFTPAPITFAIWGAIYLLIMIFAIAAIFRKPAEYITELIGNWFWISCVFNILWIFAWHFDIIWLSMIAMLGLLLSLIITETRIGKIHNIYTAGFSLYTGWITVATIANLIVLLVSLGADGFSGSLMTFATSTFVWAAILMAAIVILRKDIFYGIAGVLAYTGIVYRQYAANMLDGKYPKSAAMAIIGLAIILGSISVVTLRMTKPSYA